MKQEPILLKQFCHEEAQRTGWSAANIFIRFRRGEYPGLHERKESPRKIWVSGDRTHKLKSK